MAREYTSHPEGGKENPTWQFALDGEEFTCTLRQDADAVLEWSEIATTAVSAEGDEEMSSAAGVAFTSRFFKLMMEPKEYGRFRAHLRANRTDPDVLVEIMQDANAAMEEAVTQSTGRPTKPSSSSSSGQGARDGRTARIISLPEGDVEWADAPPPRQRRDGRRSGRQAQRNRAG